MGWLTGPELARGNSLYHLLLDLGLIPPRMANLIILEKIPPMGRVSQLVYKRGGGEIMQRTGYSYLISRDSGLRRLHSGHLL